MGEIDIRGARPDDAPFLALAMAEADRAHTGIGSWDLMLRGTDAERLPLMATLARADQRSFVHWSTFLVAQIAGEPVGTVAGYVPGDTTPEHFARACREVLGDEAGHALARHHAWSSAYFTVDMPADTLRVEWVYTSPDARGRGVSSTLVAALLARAREDGWPTAHVACYIGNEPAIATYRRAGFSEFARCRHADYEARFRTPGLVFLRRNL